MKNLWSNIVGQIAEAQRKFDISRPLLVGILLLPFAILAFQLTLTFPQFSEYKPIFWGENRPIENIQFLLFTLGVILSLRMAWFTRAQMERPIVWSFYLFVSLVLLFVGMEEIAWGQQLLDFKTPELIRAFNAQNEFTLHNIEILQDRTDILNLIFGFAGLFGLWLGTQRKYQKVGIPRILSIWFILIFVLSSLGVFNDIIKVNPQFDYSIHKQTETTELLIAAGTFLYLCFNFRLFASARVRWQKIEAFTITNSQLIVRGPRELTLAIPLNQFQWLVSASKENRENWQIASNGKCVYWPDLENSICLEQFIASRIAEEDRYGPANELLGKTYFYIAILASLIVTLWLAFIPADPKNAVIFGYSATRLAMFASVFAILYLLMRGNQKVSKDSAWTLTFSVRLHTILIARGRIWLSLILSLIGLIGGTVVLAISLTEGDPYILGFLTRLAPWAYMGQVISGLLLYYVLQKGMLISRTKIAQASTMIEDNDGVTLVLKDKSRVSLPMSSIPFLAGASDEDRRQSVLVAQGLRIAWPTLDEDVCVQRLITGSAFREIE